MKNKFILFSVALIILVSVGGYVLAQTVIDQARENIGNIEKELSGNACGVSQYPGQAQGHCKAGCDPYEDLLDSTTQNGQNTCLPSEPSCCAKTYCSANSLGVGKCKISGSCDFGAIGVNTSDCLPPQICCVAQGTAPVPNTGGIEVTPPVQESGSGSIFNTGENTNVFTGEGEGKLNLPSSGPLVPCEGFDCSLCSVFKLIQNVINFLIQFIFAVAGGFIVWGAIEIMTDVGSEKRIESGRERITTAVVGIAITLSSWLVIGFILQVLTNSPKPIPWNKIECSSAPLSLKQYNISNDNNCASNRGVCQDSSVIKVCENGKYVDGLCDTSSATNKNVKCCIPSIKSNCEEMNKNYKCLTKEAGSAYKIAGGFCPSNLECFDTTALFGTCESTPGNKCLPSPGGNSPALSYEIGVGSCSDGFTCYKVPR